MFVDQMNQRGFERAGLGVDEEENSSACAPEVIVGLQSKFHEGYHHLFFG